MICVPTSYIYFESRAFSRTLDIQKNIEKDGWNALQVYRVGIVRGMKFAEIGIKHIEDVVVVNRIK